MAHVFYAGKMISQQVDTFLTNAVLAEDVKDGALVTLGGLTADQTYTPTGDYQYDVYSASMPTGTGDTLAFVDYAGVSEGKIAGNNYKVGNKLYNLTVPAGTLTRVRIPNIHDKFWLGADNYSGTPTVGQYATAGAAYELTPAAEKPASGFAVKIIATRELTAGMHSEGKLYLNEVVAL